MPVRTWIALTMALTAAYVTHAAFHGLYIEDDAGISFAYAWSLANGLGPVLSPGEAAVEGYSNPLWTFLTAAFIKAGAFHAAWTPKLVAGAASLVAGVFATLAAARLSGRPLHPVHALAPALLAVNGSFVVWSVAGLENGLYVACILAGMWLRLRERDVEGPPWSAVAFVLVALSRPEGIGFLLLAAADVLWRRRRVVQFAALAGIPLALYFAWHAATFADPMPNTYYAEVVEDAGGPLARLLGWERPGWKYTREGFSVWHMSWALLPALGTWLAADRLRRGIPLAWALLVYSIFYVLQVGGDWMMEYRFLSPMYALLATLAAAGVSMLPRGAVPLALAGWAWTASALPAGLDRLATRRTMPMEAEPEYADNQLAIFRRFGLEKPTILRGAMGGASWSAHGRISFVDAFGLSDRTIAHCQHRSCPAEDLWAYAFDERKVDAVQVSPFIFQRWKLRESPQLKTDYLQVKEGAKHTGEYIRKDLFFAPWEDTFLTGTVNLQGALRIHRAEILSREGDTATIGVWFSLRGPPDPGRLDVAASIGGEPVQLQIFPTFPTSILRQNAVYLDRIPVPLPAETPGDLVVGEGSLVPSDLPDSARDAPALAADAPPVLDPPTGEPLDLGDFACANGPCTLAETERGDAFRLTDPGDRACTPPLVGTDDVRVGAWVKVESLTPGDKPAETLVFDARWLDAEGRRVPAPGQARRLRDPGDWQPLTLQAARPARGERVQFCWALANASGSVLVATPLVSGAEAAPEASAREGRKRSKKQVGPKKLKAPPKLGGTVLTAASLQCTPKGASCTPTTSDKGAGLRIALPNQTPPAAACTAAMSIHGTVKLAAWARIESLDSGSGPGLAADARWIGADGKRIAGKRASARARKPGAWSVLTFEAEPPPGAESVRFCWSFPGSGGTAIIPNFEVAGAR